jgi:hypothetical protein
MAAWKRDIEHEKTRNRVRVGVQDTRLETDAKIILGCSLDFLTSWSRFFEPPIGVTMRRLPFGLYASNRFPSGRSLSGDWLSFR